MTEHNAPAFPTEYEGAASYDELQTGNNTYQAIGLTKLEYFSIKALQGLLSDISGQFEKGENTGPQALAEAAVEYAEALIRELR